MVTSVITETFPLYISTEKGSTRLSFSKILRWLFPEILFFLNFDDCYFRIHRGSVSGVLELWLTVLTFIFFIMVVFIIVFNFLL